MPVSKKRKKKTRIKPSGPPVSKVELAGKKKKITRQQIFIYIFSALIIGSLAISFIIGGLGGGPVPQPQSGNGPSDIVVSPAAESPDEANGDAPSEESSTAEENQE